MTKINKLVMQGFKSFGKKTELHFENSFNCILGPNGSGKSNVMDALCFVLGKTGAKGLRVEKSANLLYNGSKSKVPAKEGFVSITFSNDKKEFPIEEDFLEITRILKSDGHSVYKINGKVVSRTQIIDLLSAARINPNGHNIVLQGDITRLVEMSTNKRRQVVEEVFGISIYESKKQKALSELEKVEKKLDEADIILAERSTYIKELKKDRDQAKKFKDLDEKIKRNKITILVNNKTSKEKESKGFDSRIKIEQKRIKTYDTAILKLKTKIEDKDEELKVLNNKVEESGEKTQVEIYKKVSDLRLETGLKKQQRENLQSELKKIQERKKELQDGLIKHNESINVIEKDKKTIQDSISKKETFVKDLELKIKEFKEKNKLDKNVDSEMEELDKNIEDNQTKINDFRAEQQILIRSKDKLEFEIEAIDEKIGKILDVEKENKNQVQELKAKKTSFKKTTLELTTALNEDSNYAAQLATARSKLLSKKEELAKINIRNSAINERRFTNLAVKKILENKTNFPGILGTIGELGSVGEKFSGALEVAAGGRIGSIVSRTDENAAKCINFLKSQRLGVASFLPLNKVRPLLIKPELRMLKGEGIYGLALDLIKFDPELTKAFQYVFGNTLIVENIDVARRLGVGKYRMVTLDGDLIEQSGAMTGGFRRKQTSGGFKEEELSEKLKVLNSEVIDLESVLTNLESKREQLVSRIDELRITKSELEGDIIKLEKLLHIDSSDFDASSSLKNKLNAELENVDKNLNSIGTEINTLVNSLTSFKIKKGTLRNKINEMKNPSVLAELNSFEEKKVELKEDISGLNAELKSKDLQKESVMGPEVNKIMSIIKKNEKEEEDFKKEIKQLEDLIKSQTKEFETKEKEQKAFYEEFKDLFNKREQLTNEKSKLEKDIILKEEKVRQVENKSNTITMGLVKLKAELAALNEEISQFGKNVKPFKDKSEEKVKKEINEFERIISNIGSVNMRALEVYEQVLSEYDKLVLKKKNLNQEREGVLMMINEIETKKKEIFIKSFSVLEVHFNRIFGQLASKNAKANLVLENKLDPFEGGLEIKVKMSGNKFLDLRSLSGGEKTLTALAFLFAVQEYKPAQFYFFDEVDAALDKRNSERLAKLINSYSSNAQYIIISHNDSMVAEADTLYGVSMIEDGISKITSLKI